MKLARRLVAAVFVTALGLGAVAVSATPAVAKDTTWGATTDASRGA